MSEEKTNDTATASTGSGGGGNKLVVILTIVNMVATLGMIAVIFISFQKSKKQASVEDIVATEAASGGHGEKKADGHGGGDAHGGGQGDKDAKKKNAEYGRIVTLEQFTVNLATPGTVNPKFVRVNISVEVPSEDSETEVTQKMPQVRNAIIDLFNSKRPTDLATSEGRDYLKEEIKNALNGFMVTGKVKGVFFTNFAVSS